MSYSCATTDECPIQFTTVYFKLVRKLAHKPLDTCNFRIFHSFFSDPCIKRALKTTNDSVQTNMSIDRMLCIWRVLLSTLYLCTISKHEIIGFLRSDIFAMFADEFIQIKCCWSLSSSHFAINVCEWWKNQYSPLKCESNDRDKSVYENIKWSCCPPIY